MQYSFLLAISRPYRKSTYMVTRENINKERKTLMTPPITKLLIKIEQLEWELGEVKKELEKLQGPFMKSLTPEERRAARLARVRAQNQRKRPLIEKALKKPDPDAKTLTAEELQRLSLEDGIDPEENLLSSAIIEEREKRSQWIFSGWTQVRMPNDTLQKRGHNWLTTFKRLLRAAQNEGLLTFDPETDTQTTLDILINSP